MGSRRQPEIPRNILNGITELTERNGFAPTTRELAAHINMWHSSCHRILLRLRDEGKVTWENGRARTLAVVQSSAPSPTTPDPSA